MKRMVYPDAEVQSSLFDIASSLDSKSDSNSNYALRTRIVSRNLQEGIDNYHCIVPHHPAYFLDRRLINMVFFPLTEMYSSRYLCSSITVRCH